MIVHNYDKSEECLNMKIVDKDGVDRWFTWVNTETKEGEELVQENGHVVRDYSNSNPDHLKYKQWTKEDPFPYDVFLFDKKIA